MKKISLKAKSVYGTIQYYPADDLSAVIAKCAGQKTITETQQRILKEAGYEIEINPAV